MPLYNQDDVMKAQSRGKNKYPKSGKATPEQLKYLTDQSNQLIKGEGPAYDKFKESVIGPLKEQGTVARKAAQRSMEKAQAKGGRARNLAGSSPAPKVYKNYPEYSGPQYGSGRPPGWIGDGRIRGTPSKGRTTH